jgi:hypothetical protein
MPKTTLAVWVIHPDDLDVSHVWPILKEFGYGVKGAIRYHNPIFAGAHLNCGGDHAGTQ